MRKFLPKILILVLVLGILSPVFVHAQSSPTDGACINHGVTPARPTAFTQSECEARAAQGFVWESGATPAATPEGIHAPPPEQPKSACGILTLDVQRCLGEILGVIAYSILTIMSYLLLVAGKLLNWTLYYTITKMSVNLKDMTGINIGWKIIRDLMNIGFIFLLLYYAIQVIIGQNDSKGVGKFISGIVIASILINFSLFFTKVLIDASNIVTIGFYNSIIGPEAASNIDGSILSGADAGLSNPIMQKLGLSSFYSKSGVDEFSKNAGKDSTSILMVGIGGTILFLITTFVFLAVSVLFVVRYITLLILLMLSPIAYMGLAFPEMKKHASDWWNTLSGQLLFAPIYMLMTWLVLTLLSSPAFATLGGGDVGFATLALGQDNKLPSSAMNLLLNFAIIIALMIATMTTAKKFASQGNSLLAKATGKATAYAGGALLGTAATAGRNTLGRAGNALAESETLKNIAQNGKISGFLAKQTMQAGNRTAQSSFDVRSTGSFRGLAKTTGVDFGKGADAKKVNFQKDLEAKAKAEADFAKMLKQSDDAQAREKDKPENKAFDGKKKETEAAYKENLKGIAALGTQRIELEKKAEEAGRMSDEAEKRRIEQKIKDIDRDIKTQTADSARLKKASEDAEKAAKANEEKIKDIGKDRIDQYAKTFEEENKMWTWTKDILKVGALGTVGYAVGGVAGAAIGGATPRITTPADNRAIARKIRKDTADKKKKMTKKERQDLIDQLGNSEEVEEKTEGDEEKPKEGSEGGDKKEDAES